MPLLFLIVACILLPAGHAVAATSAVAETPARVSVLGGESREFSARFFDALGRPAAGEAVQFVNDACGTFSNGAPVITVRADATGLASATFTARAQGITCWVAASAGIEVRWDVLTFTLPLVHFQAELIPPQPRPGQPYALAVTPMAGTYRLHEAEVSARIVPGSASATIAPSVGNSGQAGSLRFEVAPDPRIGDYEIEVQYRSRTHRIPVRAPLAPWQDLWWGGPAESGWGVSIVQHRDMLFTVVYAYDAQGRPTWYVMPGGAWNEARTAFSGPVYAPRGTPFGAYDAQSLAVGAPVGSITLDFIGANRIALDYAIGGASGRKELERQDFAPADAPLAARWDDMWWGGPAQNGWGIAILQRHRTLFAVWFTYGASGEPTWFVMPSGFWSDASTYEGRIYRASGVPWLGREYDARAFRTTDVGSFRLRFDGEAAQFEYTIDGRSGTMALSRQPF